MTQPTGKEGTPQARTGARTWMEELEVTGSELVSRVRELAHEGNTRRLTILNEQGEELLSMSLTLGAVTGGLVALSAPALAALGALAALVTHVKIVVTREEEGAQGTPQPPDRPTS